MIKLLQTANGLLLDVYVRPRSKGSKVTVEDGELVVYCVEEPVEGKVNRELVKMLSKILKVRVQLVSGFSSRQKRLLVKDVDIRQFESLLKSL
jgi:uncharacterized protein (TIGR00251 family)